MKNLDITKKEIKDEWIVEQWTKNGARAIGKVLLDQTIHLSNFDLEEIWDLANFGVSHPERVNLVGNTPYNGMTGYVSGKYIYVPTDFTDYKSMKPEPKYVSVCNGDIFIRKHYDTENGYYIHTISRMKDEWRYGKRDIWVNEMKNSRYNL